MKVSALPVLEGEGHVIGAVLQADLLPKEENASPVRPRTRRTGKRTVTGPPTADADGAGQLGLDVEDILHGAAWCGGAFGAVSESQHHLCAAGARYRVPQWPARRPVDSRAWVANELERPSRVASSSTCSMAWPARSQFLLVSEVC